MNPNSAIDISIVIPCYKEEKHILESVTEIYRVMKETERSFEIIFIDDASADKTKEKILEIEKSFPNARYLFHEKNRGKGASIADGVRIAKGKIIGHIDIDLEISAEYLPNVIAEIEKGNDIALIKRKINFNPKFILRDVGGMFHRFLVRQMLSIPSADVQSGCKFFRKDVLFSLLEKVKSPGWFFDVELMTYAYKNNYRIKQIPGYYIRSKTKRSTVNFFSDGIKQVKELFKFRKRLKRERISG